VTTDHLPYIQLHIGSIDFDGQDHIINWLTRI